MKHMKKEINILLVFLLSCFASDVLAQQSPYVELLTGYVNNTGFKSTSLRSAVVSRPVPVHVATDAVNKTVSPKFVVALADAAVVLNPLYTWAAASGWTSAANSSLAPGVIAAPATGCQSYSQLGAPAGTWRVPTQREMMIIYLVRKEFLLNLAGVVDLLLDGSLYWTSTSNSATEAWTMDFATGIMYNRSKTNTYRVRCVRDIP